MIAFLFPGQGSQQVGMGRELAAAFPVARQTFEEADAAFGPVDGPRLSDLCFHGPEDRLQLTEITQPAILAASIAACRVLAAHGVLPNVVAGHSLGEYSAHVAAGTFAFADAVAIVRRRGRYMQEAVPVGTGAMAAVIGGALGDIERICAEVRQDQVCSIANFNSPNQAVIAGNTEAVDRAVELLSGVAKRVIKLKVSAPFHCELMKPAQNRLALDLEGLKFSEPKTPVVTNVDARATTAPDELRDALVRQVSAPVRWVE